MGALRRTLTVALLGACLLLAALALAPATGLPAGPASAEAAARPPLSLGPIRVGTKRAPLTIAANSSRNATLKLRVNGTRVHDAFAYAGRRLFIADLSAGDGLRHGRNMLRVSAEAHGGVTTIRKSVRLPGPTLLADAGPDVAATAGIPTRLGTGGRGSGGNEVEYRWKIVEQPPGAEPELRRSRSPQPVLTAETPGTYKLKLEASRKGTSNTSHDRLTVPASPNDPPIGAPINTIGANGAIVVGGTPYGGGATTSSLSWAVFERATRAPKDSGSVATDATGINRLKTAIDTYSTGGAQPDYIMVISGRAGVPSGILGDFSKLAQRIGADLFSPDEFNALKGGRAFSIIGLPGAGAGAATTRIPLSPDTSGAITGYLQKNRAVVSNGTPVYDFFASAAPAYDTKTPASTPTKNVMRIGDQTIEAALTSEGTAGFQVVVLDPMTLRVAANWAFTTNVTPPADDLRFQTAIPPVFKRILRETPDATVLVQSIGHPKPAGTPWNEIADQLVKIGGNRLIVNALQGGEEYALVGRVGGDSPAVEATTAYDHGPYAAPNPPPARLTGVLSRTRSSGFEPLATDIPTPVQPDGAINTELLEIASQPLSNWPALAPGAPAGEAAAAEQYLCGKINFCKPANSCPDVRSCYWMKPGSDWVGKASDILGFPYPAGTPDAAKFSPATYAAVQSQLHKEARAVGDVYVWVARLQEPLIESSGRAYIDLQSVSKGVYQSVQSPSGSADSPALSMLSAIVGVFSLVEGGVGEMGGGIGAMLAFGAPFGDKGGDPIGDDINAKADQLGDATFERFELARRQLASVAVLLTSDHDKLMAAYSHIDSDWSLPQSGDDTETVAKLRFAAKRWFTESLVPVGYPYLIQAPTNARSMNCPIPSSSSKLWPNQPDAAQMTATTRVDGNGNGLSAVFFFARGVQGGSAPAGDFADSIFRPASQTPAGGLGLEKLSFFTPAIFNGRIVHARPNVNWCDLGWLPRYP